MFSLLPILSTEIAAASELINKISSGSNFNLNPIDAKDSIASPAPTLSMGFLANPGQEKTLFKLFISIAPLAPLVIIKF